MGIPNRLKQQLVDNILGSRDEIKIKHLEKVLTAFNFKLEDYIACRNRRIKQALIGDFAKKKKK